MIWLVPLKWWDHYRSGLQSVTTSDFTYKPMELYTWMSSDRFWDGLVWYISQENRNRTNKTGQLIWWVVSTHLKNMKVSWDNYSQYMEKEKCSKPPTSSCTTRATATLKLKRAKTNNGPGQKIRFHHPKWAWPCCWSTVHPLVRFGREYRAPQKSTLQQSFKGV